MLHRLAPERGVDRVEQPHHHRRDGDEVRGQMRSRYARVRQHRRARLVLRLQQHGGEKRRQTRERGGAKRDDQRALAFVSPIVFVRDERITVSFGCREIRFGSILTALPTLLPTSRAAARQQRLEQAQAGDDRRRHGFHALLLRAVAQREERCSVHRAGRDQELREVKP